VANEEGGAPTVDIYDLSNPTKPAPFARGNVQGTGAGWVAMARRSADDYLLFVGGAKFTQRESWLYRFKPSDKSFVRLGTFDGAPRSELASDAAWGPQHGGSLFVDRAGKVYLITQGTKGDQGNDAYRERVRCFELTLRDAGSSHAKVELRQQPPGAAENYVIDAAVHPPRLGFLFFRSPGLRWGSTFFVDEHGELILYVTARNALPELNDTHQLEIIELRQRC